MPVKLSHHASKPIVPVKRRLHMTKAHSEGPDRITSRRQTEAAQAAAQAAAPSRLLLCDFDKTIADFDAGETLLVGRR